MIINYKFIKYTISTLKQYLGMNSALEGISLNDLLSRHVGLYVYKKGHDKEKFFVIN
jgi:hypothetical protein